MLVRMRVSTVSHQTSEKMDSARKNARSAAFTEAEIHTLLSEIRCHRDLLLSKLQNSVTVKQKNRVWAEIAATPDSAVSTVCIVESNARGGQCVKGAGSQVGYNFIYYSNW